MNNQAYEGGQEKENLIPSEKPITSKFDLISTIIGVFVCVYYMFFVSGLLNRMKIYPHIVSHQALIFGLITVSVFMLFPAKKGGPKRTLPWYDFVFIALTLLVSLYLFFFYNQILDHWQIQSFTWFEVLFGLISLIVVLESGRRTIGWPMVLVALFFLFHALFCNYFPGFLRGRGYSLERISTLLYMTEEGLWGPPMNAVVTIVMAFIILGQFFFDTGAGAFFTDTASSVIGHVRGGAAKVSVFSSAAFGTVSGSTSANIVVDGVFTIPMMKKSGFPAHFAGAVEAVTSNGGQIMPPVMGAVAFIMAQILAIPYKDVCIAAALPACLYFFGLFMMIDFEAARLNIRGLPRDQLPRLTKVVKEGWFYLVPLAILLFLLMVLFYAPEVAGLYALLSLYVVCLFKKESRMGLGRVIRTFDAATRSLAQVIPAVAMAGIIIGCLSLTGVAFRLSAILITLSGGSVMILLLLCAMTSFILGMGMTSIPCYLILVMLVAPALQEAGVPLLASHLFMFWFGLVSFLTPPVAIGAYVAASIAKSDPFKTGWAATRLGFPTFILPFIFVYNPALLLMGPWPSVIQAVISSMIGMTALASSLSGYGLKKMGWWERCFAFVGGILLIIPGWKTDLMGVILILPVFVHQYRKVYGVRLEAFGMKAGSNCNHEKKDV